MATFTARYHGTCASCGAPIRIGDEVCYTTDTDGDRSELVHVTCDDEVAVVMPPCPRCFMILPRSGVCDSCE